MKPLKGQMVFEFVVATILFIGIVFYVIATLNGTMSDFTGNYYRNRINEEAQRVSEILVHTRGVWEYGAPPVPKQPGLAAEWPVLDDMQIKYLSSYCENTENAKKLASLLGLEGRWRAGGMRIMLSNASQIIASCWTGDPSGEQAYAERFAYTNESGTVKLGVYVW